MRNVLSDRRRRRDPAAVEIRHRRDFDESPRITLLEEFGGKRGMQCVAAAMHDEVSEERMSDQREIPQHVQNLVADELVFEPQRIEDARFAEHDRVLE